MYRAINRTIAGLTDEQKESVNLDSIAFEGFDANHDGHFGYMEFMVEEMSLYSEHKGNYLNSHSQATLGKYRRMLAYYKEKIKQKNDYSIDFEDIKKMTELVCHVT